MSSDQSFFQFSNSIRQLSAPIKSTNFVISESKIVMALLNGLPEEFNPLISALDSIDEDETKVKFEFAKSRLTQEEQRIIRRTQSAQAKSETAALLYTRPGNSSRHCG